MLNYQRVTCILSMVYDWVDHGLPHPKLIKSQLSSVPKATSQVAKASATRSAMRCGPPLRSPAQRPSRRPTLRERGLDMTGNRGFPSAVNLYGFNSDLSWIYNVLIFLVIYSDLSWIHHGYPSKWMYLSWIQNEFSIQISPRCRVLMHTLVDVIGFSTKSWDFIDQNWLCYPFKRTSGYIPINMENQNGLIAVSCYSVPEKSGFCHRCQDGGKMKISQETTNRYTTHTTKKLDETSLDLPGKQDILGQHNITKSWMSPVTNNVGGIPSKHMQVCWYWARKLWGVPS